MIFYIPVIEVINWIGIYVTEDSIRLRPKIKIMSRKIRYVKIYVINFVLPTQRIMIYSRLLFRWAWYVRDNLANKIMGPLSKKSPVNRSSSSFQFQQLLPPVTVGGKIVRKISHPAAQSHIWMGLPVLARHETDHIFPMLVANHILGGSGFGSRLTKEIREERGLSYSVFSAFSLLKQKGPFFIGLQTGKENSDEAIEVMVNTVNEYIKNGPSEEELEIAKQGIVGGFALRLDSNSKILENLAQIVFYDLPLDYLDNWTLRIQAVTLDDVKKVLKERVDLNSSSLIVVGYKE